ncbi:fibronectin type-III domain-containing protein, partial [Trichonephila clavata]
APESPHDCLVTNQTLDSLTIECQAGHNGSLPQIFHMEIYNSLVEHMADNLTRLDKPRFKVTDLSPSTSYVLVIYASNVKGRSDSVALVATTLSTAGRRTVQNEKLPFNPIISILIGVAILFVLVGVAVVIIVVRSHTSKQEATKDTVIAETSTDQKVPFFHTVIKFREEMLHQQCMKTIFRIFDLEYANIREKYLGDHILRLR